VGVQRVGLFCIAALSGNSTKAILSSITHEGLVDPLELPQASKVKSDEI